MMPTDVERRSGFVNSSSYPRSGLSSSPVTPKAECRCHKQISRGGSLLFR